MTALPTWATTPEALDLLREIEATIPKKQFFDSSHNLGGRGQEYRGRAVGALRRLHDAALVRALAADDADYFAGRPNAERFKAVLHPTTDELIDGVFAGEIVLPVARKAAA